MAPETQTPVPAPETSTPTPEPIPTPAPAATPVPAEGPKPVEEKGKMKWLYVAVILMGIIALGLVGYIAYTEIFMEDAQEASDDSGDDFEEQEDDTDLNIEEEATTPFTGDAISADLPAGWSIVEYLDGDGTDMLTDGVVYTGLTGLEIVTPGEGAVFTLEAVYGIGGVDACEEYYQFADNSTDFYDMIVETSSENNVVPTIVDYTDTEYTEFVFLGMSLRRIDQRIYNDDVEGDEYFQAGCGMTYGLWNPDGLSFIADGEEHSTYQWDINDEADEVILLELDAILESIETI